MGRAEWWAEGVGFGAMARNAFLWQLIETRKILGAPWALGILGPFCFINLGFR
jgi:hypothetical protein